VKLFDEDERTNISYIADGESHYAYLNKTARPEFVAARDLLEDWFTAYPASAQATLASKFKSDKYGIHLGAFFELYCYALLKACHFSPLVEQVVTAEKGNPIDFVAGSLQAPDFCVESTVIADPDLTERNRQQLDTLKDRLNALSANRRLYLDVISTSKQQLPYSEIVARVKEWLTTLDAGTEPFPTSDDDGDTEVEKGSSHLWTGGGWALQFDVLPGARVGDLVPVQGDRAGWVGTMSRLRKTLQEKAEQHDSIQAPYIIAVDIVSIEAMFRSDESILDDLFGQTIFLFDRDTGQLTGVKRSPELPRRSDREKGFWFGRSGPRNQHVSAVLLVNSVLPWSLLNQTPKLLHNPWARHPVSPDIWPGPQMLVTDLEAGEYGRRDGKTIVEIFRQGQ
jgi:hypothetical protein